MSALAAAMLQLTLDTSPAAASEVADRLNGLAAQPFPSGDAESGRALLAHGGLLHDLLPTTDGVLRALLAAPSKGELKALRTMILTRQTASRATAREFRVLLYATSLALVGVLVHLQSFCAAYHAAMEAISDSEKPLAMRSITVA